MLQHSRSRLSIQSAYPTCCIYTSFSSGETRTENEFHKWHNNYYALESSSYKYQEFHTRVDLSCSFSHHCSNRFGHCTRSTVVSVPIPVFKSNGWSYHVSNRWLYHSISDRFRSQHMHHPRMCSAGGTNDSCDESVC